MRIAALVLVIVAALVLLWRPQPLASCGPFFTGYVFAPATGFSLNDAAGGKWEVFQPSFRHVSLILAYRYLSGVKLTPEELKILSPEPRVLTQEEVLDSWPPGLHTWREARKKVPRAPAVGELSVFRRQNQFQSSPNCLGDGLRAASRALGDRIRQFGAGSREVEHWLSAQDTVFRNCSGPPLVIPPAAPPDLPPLIRADRAYQIAAAHFYAGDYEEAARRFREIGADSSSPWSGSAPYLVARCLIRQASALESTTPLSQAEAQLQSVLADDGRKAWHEPARGLLGFVRARLRPQERRVELAGTLSSPGLPENLARTLVDYHYLLDRLPAAATPNDDLTDWVLTFKAQGQSAVEHSYARWKAGSALSWLVAAISKLPARDPRTEELLAAAAAVQADSPAYPSVAFHTVRLLNAAGRGDEARRRLDSLLSAAADGFTAGPRNLFRAQRMQLARDLDEFLRDAPREVVGTTFDDDNENPRAPRDPSILFDADAAAVLNEKLPLRLLQRSTASKALPLPLRREITLAAWVRAVLLRDDKTSQSLAGTAAELAPDLRPRFEAFLGASQKRFAAIYLLLQTPGLRPFVTAALQRRTPDAGEIDSIRDNWWCSFGELRQLPGSNWNYYERCCILSGVLRPLMPDGAAGFPAFLSEGDRAAAAAEWRLLESIPTAPNLLAAEAVAYAMSHPDDPRVPESLHLAVRSTRFGCTDEETGKFSRQAFDLLHRRYPASPWAAKTKYWYR